MSFGCFIEHDTAKACLRTSADVIQTHSIGRGCSWNDVGYIIPQTVLPAAVVQELVQRLGEALLLEQHIGFFGADVVVFCDEEEQVLVEFSDVSIF